MAVESSEREMPRPLAAGDLKSVPLSHVFLHLHAKQMDGTLVVRVGQEIRALVKIGRGRPRALRGENTGGDLQELLLPLCGSSTGTYEFYGVDLLATPGPMVRGSVDPLAMVAASIRHNARDDVAGALLSRYGGHPMRLQAGQPIDRLDLELREQTVVDLLRAGPETVENMQRLSPLPVAETRRLLYLLIITKMVAPMDRPTSVSHVRMSSVAPPPAQSLVPMGRDGSARPSTGALRSAPSMSPGSPGSPSWSTKPPLSTATTQSMRPARPGQVSASPPTTGGAAGARGAGGPSVRPRAQSTQSLRSPAAASMRPGMRSTAPATPEGKFKLAEKRLLAGYPDDALRIVDELLESDPKRASYLGMRAHALFVGMRAAPGTSVANDVLSAIQEALLADENEPRALYAKGLAFQQVGKLKNALHFFRLASEADRSFIAAKRDAHLVALRIRQGS